MNNDIVTRLRGQRTNGVLCEQAADEIERLREWKELAYEIYNRTLRSPYAYTVDRKLINKFKDLHKADWELRKADWETK